MAYKGKDRGKSYSKPRYTAPQGRKDRGYNVKNKPQTPIYDERKEAVAEQQLTRAIPKPETLYRRTGGKGYGGAYFNYPPLSAYPNAPNGSLLPPEIIASTNAPQEWANAIFSTPSYLKFRDRFTGKTSAPQTPIKPTGVGTVRQHGYHQYVTNKVYGGQGGVQPVQAAGTTAPVGPAYPTTPYQAGYGYGYGGGGGYDYGSYNNPYNRYRGGYAAESGAAPNPLGVRAVQQANPYRGYATQNMAARWIQNLVNWRIG